MPIENNGISTNPSNHINPSQDVSQADKTLPKTHNERNPEKINQFAESSKSDPLNLRITHANIKYHNVSIGDGYIQRKLFSFFEFLRDIFEHTKSWLGIASKKGFLEDTTLPIFLVKHAENNGDGTYTTHHALNNIQNKLFEELVTSLTGKLLTENLAPENQSINGHFSVDKDSSAKYGEKSKEVMPPHGLTHQFIRDMAGEGILIDDKLYFDQTKKGELKTAEQLTEYLNTVRDKIVELCNGNELAAVVLCRFINQQITVDATKSFKFIPLGKDHKTGYFAINPRPSYELKKPNSDGPVKLIINMKWTAKDNQITLGEGMDAEYFDDPSEVLSEAKFNFELEFNPPKRNPENNPETMNASYFMRNMKLSKGLTIEVREKDADFLAIQNALLESSQEDPPALEESQEPSSVVETQDESFDAIAAGSVASNALHSEQSQKAQ